MAPNRIKRFLMRDNVCWIFDDDLSPVRDIVEYDDSFDPASMEPLLMQDTYESADAGSEILSYTSFNFTGRDRDADHELQYHRARHHDATVGRWVSEDPY